MTCSEFVAEKIDVLENSAMQVLGVWKRNAVTMAGRRSSNEIRCSLCTMSKDVINDAICNNEVVTTIDTVNN